MWAHHILVPGWCMCACVFWLQAHTWLNKSPSWTKLSNFHELKGNKNDRKSLRRFSSSEKPKPMLPINSSIAPYERRQMPSLIKNRTYFIFSFSFPNCLLSSHNCVRRRRTYTTHVSFQSRGFYDIQRGNQAISAFRRHLGQTDTYGLDLMQVSRLASMRSGFHWKLGG